MPLARGKAAARVKLANILKRAGYGSQKQGSNLLRAIDYPVPIGAALNLVGEEGDWKVEINGETARTKESSRYAMTGSAGGEIKKMDVTDDRSGIRLATGALPHSINVPMLDESRMFPANKIKVVKFEEEIKTCTIEWRFHYSVTIGSQSESATFTNTWTANLNETFVSEKPTQIKDPPSYFPDAMALSIIDNLFATILGKAYIFERVDGAYQLRNPNGPQLVAQIFLRDNLHFIFEPINSSIEPNEGYEVYTVPATVSVVTGTPLTVIKTRVEMEDTAIYPLPIYTSSLTAEVSISEVSETDTFFHALAADPKNWPVPEWLKFSGPESK